jgi:hypothetical protein
MVSRTASAACGSRLEPKAIVKRRVIKANSKMEWHMVGAKRNQVLGHTVGNLKRINGTDSVRSSFEFGCA